MISREWKIQKQPEKEINDLSAALHILPLTAKLLWNRGCRTAEEAERFVKKEEGVFHDPFALKDMDKATERIELALSRGERITIFGDYDVDGVTATCILYQYLSGQGADVRFYIPGRLDEGYGLGAEAVKRIAADGTKLIVTVDTGVTAVEEAEMIAALGMELVVTDHHECRPQLPACCAVVNPRRQDCSYPFKELAGVGVVFKLLCALEKTLHREEDAAYSAPERLDRQTERLRRVCLDYAEYTAIGTIADVMPLRDENRLIVNLGLGLLQKTEKPGLNALIEHASAIGENKTKYPPKKRKITSSFIGYTIAPRINAAGRIAHASRAVELFLTDSAEEADRIAAELCDANHERQETENTIAEEAFAQIAAEHDPAHEHILILAGEHWHHGVIGIVASRVTEKYHIPSILISFEGSEDTGKGSGRSVEGFDLVAGLTACEDLLVRFGGHAQAAGLTVTRGNLPEFRRRMEACAASAFGGTIPAPTLTLDCETGFDDVRISSAEELYLLEPFGTANPAPLFCLYGAQIVSITELSGGKHTKLCVCDPADRTVCRTAMLFGVRAETLPFREGDIADLAYQMDINEFQGARTVQMLVQDIRPNEKYPHYRAREEELYQTLRAGKPVPYAPIAPAREDFAAVWKLLRNGGPAYDYLALAYYSGIPYHRIRLILDIFEETGLLQLRSHTKDGIVASPVQNNGQKTDLTASKTMRLLLTYGGQQ